MHQIAVPPDARSLSTLDHIDYADAFVLHLDEAGERTAEQWARAILEDAPLSTRTALLSGWSMLGLKIGQIPSDGSVLGWQIRRAAHDFVLLGAGSRVGMPGELLVKRLEDGLLFDTFVQHGNIIARALWASVEATHVRVVRDLLDRFGRRLGR
ncbi:MAG: hypothetical protein JO152_09930 [Mycobacteriaceae bacterium]|nr:hypothetical protein [Mycobacteriaceae bacterium]